MKATIFSLYDGDFHAGLGALVNSCVFHGFEGDFVVGYRGSLPSWFSGEQESGGASRMRLDSAVTIFFKPLAEGASINLLKPKFMLEQMQQPDFDADVVYWFDTDITLAIPFDFFVDWAQLGISTCEDQGPPRPPSDPRFLQWVQFSQAHGKTIYNSGSSYCNSGFVGLQRQAFGFLKEWQEALELVQTETGDSCGLLSGVWYNPFHFTDQDALNLALRWTRHPVSIMGRNAMGFFPRENIMYHAVGHPKPWQKKFVFRALSGDRPTVADAQFLSFSHSPIAVYSSAIQKRRSFERKLASAICRLTGRTG